jgi:DNA-binding transcriptional LysR family regulator
MIDPSPGWELYRTFLAVMTGGSLSAAARHLGLTQPTVGRHIDALEEALGVALFARSPHGLAATEAAVELRPHAEAMAGAASAIVRSASGLASGIAGTVRITASEVVGAEVLPPILTALHADYPRLVIELVLSNRLDDLLHRAADIAVRMVRPTQAQLVARHVGEVRGGLYAHRRYVERRGMPKSEDDLAGHAIVGFDTQPPNVSGVEDLAARYNRDLFAFRSDSDLAQIAMIRAGLGIGGIQHGIARRDRDLVPVLPRTISFSLDMWLAMHEDQRANRRLRLVYDRLAVGLAAQVKARAPR